MGREDAVKILQAGCSIYRIITLEESMSLPTVLENDDSLVLQQNGGSNWIYFLWNQFHERNAKIFLKIRKEKEVFHKRHTQIHYYPSLFILIVVVIILVFYVLFTIYVFDQYSFVKEKICCFFQCVTQLHLGHNSCSGMSKKPYGNDKNWMWIVKETL